MKPILETIDTRFGTASKHAFSRGNTLPYTGVPFGMNYFVPQTSDQEGSWFFNPHIPIFQGIRLRQIQGKKLSLYLHAADALSLEQVDERTVSLGQSGLTETNKSPLVMFTSFVFSKDILSIKQEGQDWRIDLAGAEALVQLATSFISKEQTLFNLPRKDFEETKSEAKASYDLGIPLFDHLRVYLTEKNQWLDIRTQQNHEHFHFVKNCQLDEKEVQSIRHQDLLDAQTLNFTLSWLPKHN